MDSFSSGIRLCFTSVMKSAIMPLNYSLRKENSMVKERNKDGGLSEGDDYIL